MQFLSVNFDLNQKYYVDKTAFEQSIRKSINDISEIKIDNIQTIINKDKYGEQIEIIINISLNSQEKMDQIILKISSNIDIAVQNLIDSKPKNIQIKIKGDSNE